MDGILVDDLQVCSWPNHFVQHGDCLSLLHLCIWLLIVLRVRGIVPDLLVVSDLFSRTHLKLLEMVQARGDTSADFIAHQLKVVASLLNLGLCILLLEYHKVLFLHSVLNLPQTVPLLL